MSYIKSILGKHERLVSMTRLHWIYVVEGVFWLVLFLALGLAYDHYMARYGGERGQIYNLYPGITLPFVVPFSPLALTCFVIGIYLFWILLLKYICTEIVLTDRRLVFKQGLIRVEIEETDLSEVHAEQIRHGLLGYFLGYGRVHLDCRFVSDIFLPAIRNPMRLVRAIQTVKGATRNDLDDDLKNL